MIELAVRHANAASGFVQTAVIGTKGKDQPAIMLRRKSERRLALPALPDVGTGVAPDAKVVAGQVVPLLPHHGAHAADPAEAGIVAGAVNEAIADEANAHGVITVQISSPAQRGGGREGVIRAAPLPQPSPAAREREFAHGLYGWLIRCCWKNASTAASSF